ncbi:hypothetical protein ACJIZ3_023787 [Penstemon smallii]|uniref:Uncharacterized protein n=1 Tax=Penstemon smallii TaxID=265156 RepID=A0ABD3TQ02_9LAMI
MKNYKKEELVHILRRQSNGFSRGASKYKGVTLHKCGQSEARMGQLIGKDVSKLPLFKSILRLCYSDRKRGECEFIRKVIQVRR